MKRFLSIAMALCIGLTMSLDANAKRFGGGKSSGAAPTHQTSQMAPSSAAGGAAATAGAAGAAGVAAKAGGASRWLGPLAGIAAGGLLASMFMGGGFQGMQIFDILIMAVIAFLIFRFIAARRRKQQGRRDDAAEDLRGGRGGRLLRDCRRLDEGCRRTDRGHASSSSR